MAIELVKMSSFYIAVVFAHCLLFCPYRSNRLWCRTMPYENSSLICILIRWISHFIADADGKLKQRSLPNLSNDSKLSLSAGNDLDNVDAIEEQNGSNSRYSPSLHSNGSSPGAISPVENTAKSRLDGPPANSNNGTRCDSPTLALQKSGIPLAKSCLPRPSSSSKLPAPSRLVLIRIR